MNNQLNLPLEDPLKFLNLEQTIQAISSMKVFHGLTANGAIPQNERLGICYNWQSWGCGQSYQIVGALSPSWPLRHPVSPSTAPILFDHKPLWEGHNRELRLSLMRHILVKLKVHESWLRAEPE